MYQKGMKVTTLNCYDINDAWFSAVREVLQHGKWRRIDDGSFAGIRRLELDYLLLSISYPGTRPLEVQLCPNFPIPSPVAPGYLVKYLEYLITKKSNENEEYTYGDFIEAQLQMVIDKFRKSGFGTNQCCITIGNEKSIFLDNPPCLKVIDMRIGDDDVLHWFLYFRSWDVWAGLPANLGGLQLLKEYVAKELKVIDGTIIVCSKGAHLYEYIAPELLDYFAVERSDL